MAIAPPETIRSDQFVQQLQALADSNRVRILDALRDGEQCVCHLTESLGMGQPLLSHHLKVLREAGLVSGRREGRWVHYSLSPRVLRMLADHLGEMAEAGSGSSNPAECR